jgi:hypothetical protein
MLGLIERSRYQTQTWTHGGVGLDCQRDALTIVFFTSSTRGNDHKNFKQSKHTMEHTSEQGFDSYVITTNDPGPMFLVTVVGLSLMLFGVIILVAFRSSPSSSPHSQQIDVDHMEGINQYLLSEANCKDIGSRTSSDYGATLFIPVGLTSNQKIDLPSPSGEGNGKENATESPLIRRSSLTSFFSPTKRPSSGSLKTITGCSHPDYDEQHDPTTVGFSQQDLSRETSETFSVHNDDDDNDDNKVDVNVMEFCNSSTSTVQKLRLILCHNCDPISQSIYDLCGPFLIQAIVAAASEMLRLALVGHQLGTAALSSFVIVDLVVRLTSDVVGSIIISGNTLITQISGEPASSNERVNAFKAGRYLQLSMILYVLGSLPFIVIWSNSMGQVLLFLGYDDKTAEIGRLFATPYALASLFGGLCTGLHFMLDVIGHEVESTILTGVAEAGTTSVLALYLCWKFLFPTASLVDMGYVYLTCKLLYLLILCMVIQRQKWLNDYAEGLFLFKNQQTMASEVDDQELIAFSNTEAISLMLTNASSVAVATLVLHGELQILIFFARYGTNKVVLK